MTRSAYRIGSMLALAAALGLARTAAASDAVPIQGRVVVAQTSAVPYASGLLVTFAGSGQATLLGSFTRNDVVVGAPDGSFSGPVIFTAANGDQLVAIVHGSANSPTGTYTFIGGTGRFEQVTGSAAFQAATTDGAHFTIDFAGTLSAPDHSKK